jgi:hypothetical protein
MHGKNFSVLIALTSKKVCHENKVNHNEHVHMSMILFRVEGNVLEPDSHKCVKKLIVFSYYNT